jgi:hypothetical protein
MQAVERVRSSLIAQLRAELSMLDDRGLPPFCPACEPDGKVHAAPLQIEDLGHGRFWCGLCSRSFSALQTDAGWIFDLTPLRYASKRPTVNGVAVQ